VFEPVMTRRRRPIYVLQSNAARHAFTFWDEAVESVAAEYPAVEAERVLVDSPRVYFVTRPEHFDVVVAPACSWTSSPISVP
jgi:isocitrate/isopropylmalate dehydrogenase